MTTQDESAAWLAANRPDLVNAPVVSAQQAAATNAAYQNNTLPVLPTYSLWGAPQYADYSQIPQAERAQYAQLEGSNLISGYNQVGQQTYFTPQEFQQRYGMTDVQYEQAKYNVYNNPSAVNPATLPPDLAGAYQQQIRQNQGEQPSAQFNEINRQYALQQNRVVGSEGVMYQGAATPKNPFPEDSAAGIAWLVGRQSSKEYDPLTGEFVTAGGRITKSMQKTANLESATLGAPTFFSGMNTTLGRSVVANPNALVDAEYAGFSPVEGRSMYIRIGNLGTTQLRENAKVVFAPSGGFGILQVVPNNIPGSDFKRIYPMIVAGGSDYSLQGLALSGSPLIKDSSGNITKAGVYDAYGNRMWGEMTGEGALWQSIRFDSSKYSKTGRELYGGFVQLKDDRTIQSQEAAGIDVLPAVYAPELSTYSSLVSIDAENVPRRSIANFSDLPAFGAIGPSQFASMPTAQIVDMSGKMSPVSLGGVDLKGMGIMPAGASSLSTPSTKEPAKSLFGEDAIFAETTAPVFGDRVSTTPKEYLNPKFTIPGLSPTGGFGAMAADNMGVSIEYADGRPLEAQTPKPSPNEYQPSGFLGLGGLLPQISDDTFKAWGTNYKSRPVEGAINLLKGGVEGEVSMVQGITSFFAGGISEYSYGWKPTPIVVNGGTTQSITSKTVDLPTLKNTTVMNLPESSTLSGGNQTITDLGLWLESSKNSIDRTNTTAVKDYNAKVDLFAKMQEQNPMLVTTIGGTKSIITESGGTKTITTTSGESLQKIYPGELDRFFEGSGRVGRWLTGETLEKQAAYETTLQGDASLVGEAKRGVFYFGTEAINNPAKVALVAAQAVTIAKGISLAPSFLTNMAAGTGITAKGANFLLTPGGSSLAKAAAVGVFGTAYTYGVTDKFTATPEQTKENIYRSGPYLAAMYGGAGGFDWVGETTIVKGASSPSGATFSGLQIYDTFFGGGKTPAGSRYVGAFSPKESYVFTGAVPGGSSVKTPPSSGILELPAPYEDAGVGGSWEKPSVQQQQVLQFEGPARDLSRVDISGGSLPFSVATEAELQAAALSRFRDTSGGAAPFSLKTEATVTPSKPSAAPKVSQLGGDTSGGSPTFSLKTQQEVDAGVWDQPVQIGGDVSGRAPSFSLNTESEFLSNLPRDVSGKADPFSVQTQGEILSGWEIGRANVKQVRSDIQWAENVARNRVVPGFMDTIIDTQSSLKVPSSPKVAWTRWKEPILSPPPLMELERVDPQTTNRGYAPAPEEIPFEIPGMSDGMKAELANMNPAFRDQALSRGMEAELQSMHPAYRERFYSLTGEKPPLTFIEREGSYTRVEEEAAARIAANTKPTRKTKYAVAPIGGNKPSSGESGIYKKGFGFIVPGNKNTIPTIDPWKRTSVGFGSWEKTTGITIPSRSSTEITTPYSRQTTIVTPFGTTTPREQTTTKVTPLEQEFPWKRITETPQPTKYANPLPPIPATPIIGIPFNLPGGGGSSSGGFLKGSRKYVETLGFAYSKRGMDAFTKKTFAKKKIRGIK